MITIPLYSLLIIYAAFLIFFGVLSAINLSHLAHTGALTFVSFMVTLIMVIIVILIFFGTWYLLKDFDWQTPLTVWNSAWTGSMDNAF